MSIDPAEKRAPSSCVICGHRAIWHHDERGCQYHGNGRGRCACRRNSDQVVARVIHEAMTAAASLWLDASVDGTRPVPADHGTDRADEEGEA